MEYDIHNIETDIRNRVENNTYNKEDSANVGGMFDALFPDEGQRDVKHRVVSAFMDFVFNVPGGQSLVDYRLKVCDELKKVFIKEAAIPSGVSARYPHWIKEVDYLARTTPFGQNKPDNIHEILAAIIDLKSALFDVGIVAKPKMTILTNLLMFCKASKHARLDIASKRSNAVKMYNHLNGSNAQGKDKTIGRKR